MKHIFKKLHHHPNRSNENPQTPPTPSPSCSENRANPSSSSSPAASTAVASSTTSAAATSTSDEGNSLQQQYTQQDFISSEEEYQYQLALAISASSSGRDTGVVDSRKAPIRSADNGKAAADLMSRRYWDFGILDFEERIVDGFYDVHSLSSDSADRENMPSLADIESNNGASNYEVVIVNRTIDPALEELMQIAHCIVLDCPTTEMLIDRLSELVTKHLGGPVRDANIILAKFMERNMELRTSLHTVVLPIGSLRIGLSRHRALLFKALADSVGIHCRLVKGSHYTGMEDDAVNIIKLHDGSECLVDLMGAPGTLIPADTSGKDIPYSHNPEPSNLSCLQTTNSTSAASAQPQLNYVGGYNFPLGTTSWKPEALLSNRSANDGVGTSRQSEKVPFNELDHSLPDGIERSSFYKGGRGPNLPGDGMRLNLNMTPYSSKSPEDPNNIFSELNPFQIKESGKPVLRNGRANKVGKLQFSKGNVATSLSPAPLLWKNRQACNELSKENSSVGGSLVENNQAAINGNASAVVSRSSKVLPEENCSSHAPFSNSNFTVEESGPSQLSWEKMSCSSDTDMFSLEDLDIMKGECKLEDHQNGVTIVHEDDKNVQDRLIGKATKLIESEATSCSLDLRANFVDTEIDDVGECEIVWEDLVLGERIGLGSYGEVYRADWNGTEVAVKKFLDQDFSGAALDEFKREVRIMRRLRHPNVVLFMGAVTRPPNLSIITEFLPRGSLYRIIHRPHCQIDEKRRIKMALDVAKGMNCLHTSTPTIVHRDLKSPNLLVDHNWNVKVCDFGLSRLKHNTFLSSKSTGGTPEWMAPEVLRNEPSNEKCDVYSFGVILWELATLKLPWSGMNPMQVVGAVGFQNRRLDIPKEVDPHVARIIWKCWETDPNQRPSFAQLSRALKRLQRLAVPSHVEPQIASLPQEITVNSTQEMHLFFVGQETIIQ